MAEVTKDKEAINGAKFRTHEKANGFWTDPFTTNDFYSRTFMPKGTKFLEAQEEEEMKTKIKADNDVKFKDEDLSDDTKDKLEKDVDLKDKVEKEK